MISWMARHAAGALAGALMMALVLTSSAAGEVGDDAPDFVLRSVSGGNLRLSEYRGDVIALTFWASWCSECSGEIARLAELRRRYRDAGLTVMVVSVDRDSHRTSHALEGADASLPVLHDVDGDVGRVYGVTSLPFTVLVDRHGAIRDIMTRERRGTGSGDLLTDRVRALLRE